MNGQSFRKKIDRMWKELASNIEKINREDTDVISQAENILMETDAAIRKVKILLRSYEFADWSEEINFFKNTKPQFVSLYIYYSKILSIEASKPYANPEALKDYYDAERKNLLYFFNEHREFISYYRRKSTFLDKKYFVRYKFDFKLKLSPELYSYDEEFSTSHDHIVAQIIANDMLDDYLAKRLESKNAQEKSLTNSKKLEWTAPKVALIELLYALHQTKCFNGGQADLAEVFRWAEKSLNVQLGNYHKTFGEIRIRKNERSRFMTLLQNNLNDFFNKLDE